jgi:hypothetical protein
LSRPGRGHCKEVRGPDELSPVGGRRVQLVRSLCMKVPGLVWRVAGTGLAQLCDEVCRFHRVGVRCQ